ncbi:MAG: hypothetical protein OEW12_06905 [Deltaproteobacteria bacterium]|nr:hypothetical protein [Deltaproteobacteria bacterium]
MKTPKTPEKPKASQKPQKPAYSPPPAPKPEEQTLYGQKACWAVYRHRPQDILRIFYRDTRARELAPILKWAAAGRLVYRELDEESMRRVAGTPHHEGVAMAVAPLCYQSLGSLRPQGVWLALDRVENPYNMGALWRSAAFFGVEAVLAGGLQPGAKANAGAVRASEGGAEALKLIAAPDLAETLKQLTRQGVEVVGLETGSGNPLAGFHPAGPVVLVVGHELDGLSLPVRAAATRLLEIQGMGGVGSLNVSVAAGIALAALTQSAG